MTTESEEEGDKPRGLAGKKLWAASGIIFGADKTQQNDAKPGNKWIIIKGR